MASANLKTSRTLALFVAFAALLALPVRALPSPDESVLVRWPGSQIEWCYDPSRAPEYFADPEQFTRLLERAMRAWEDGAAIKFHHTEGNASCTFSGSQRVLVAAWGDLPSREAARGGVSINGNPWLMAARDGIVSTAGGSIIVNLQDSQNLGPETVDKEDWERGFIGKLTHELGHVLGLRHSLDANSIMWPNTTMNYTPSTADLHMVATLYGLPAFPYTRRRETVQAQDPVGTRWVVSDQQGNQVTAINGQSNAWTFVSLTYPDTSASVGFVVIDPFKRERARVIQHLPLEHQRCSNGQCVVSVALAREVNLAALEQGASIYILTNNSAVGTLTLPPVINNERSMPSVSVSTSVLEARVDEPVVLRVAFSANPRGVASRVHWRIPSSDGVEFEVPSEGATFDLTTKFGEEASIDSWLTVESAGPAASTSDAFSFGFNDVIKVHINVQPTSAAVNDDDDGISGVG